MDITQLILDDHHEQRRLFAILEQVGRADTGTLSAVWERLSSFLELHAAAEEEIFYPELLQVGVGAGRTDRREGGTPHAIPDHHEIRAAVAAVNLANSDHMAEEEREGLTDFRRLARLQLRHDLAVAFAAFEARHFAGVPPVDKDPATYVREAEQKSEPPGSRGVTDGSLSIGSLKEH